MAKRMAMCSASFSRVGLSDESEGACAARADRAWLTVKRARRGRVERLRIEFLIGTFAGARDLREHLHDAFEFVLVQSHQAGFDGHGTCASASGTAAANSSGGISPAAGLADLGGFADGVCQIPSARTGATATGGT